MLFAEGSATNGLNLSRFRRGAFCGLHAVRPSIIKIHWKYVCPDTSNTIGMEQFPLIISECNLKPLNVTHFPIFVPNEYLFTEYAKTIEGHEKMEKWQIYAHALEDFMRKAGGFGTSTLPLREKVSYLNFMGGKKDEITINGSTFYYPHREGENEK